MAGTNTSGGGGHAGPCPTSLARWPSEIRLCREGSFCSSRPMRQRYDDFADWYDTYVTQGPGKAIAWSADRLLTELLGPADARPAGGRSSVERFGGERLCLDLGCGGGAHVPVLTGLG